MQKDQTEKHKSPGPNPRTIRRACSRELYRTAKRLKLRLSDEVMKQAEDLYYKKVLLHIAFIVANGSNRKALADWWDEHVSAEIAVLWNVEKDKCSQAFRSAFGA
jgi:hypothetical protein